MYCSGAGRVRGQRDGVHVMSRLYSFNELMDRLRSPTWYVVMHCGEFIFMPCIYKGKPKQESK